MKNIYEINKWTIIVMFVLYLTFWGGILLHFALALIQLFSFGRYIKNWSSIKPTLKPLLLIYGFIAIPLVILFFIFPETFMMIIWIGSIFLALYFLYITYKQYKYTVHEL